MKNVFVILIFFCSIIICAQNKKFEEFNLVSYEIDNNNIVQIDSYATINQKGKMNVFLNGSVVGKYFSYQLNDQQMKNLIYLNGKNLDDFIKEKKLGINEGYAGNRNFLEFKNKKNGQNLSFIAPFMNDQFKDIFNMLEDIMYSQEVSAKVQKFEIDFQKLKSSISKTDSKYNYLPKKSLPPPPMRLK